MQEMRTVLCEKIQQYNSLIVSAGEAPSSRDAALVTSLFLSGVLGRTLPHSQPPSNPVTSPPPHSLLASRQSAMAVDNAEGDEVTAMMNSCRCYLEDLGVSFALPPCCSSQV